MPTAIEALQLEMVRAAKRETKEWWERYLKGAISFRGLGIPEIRRVVRAWRREQGLDERPVDEQFRLAMSLIAQPLAEDKLAGILYIQEHIPEALPWSDMLKRFSGLYEAGLIADWNTCDWFCVRVLGPMIEREGMPAAEAIAAWKDAENLWQARSAAVPFTVVAENAEYCPLVEQVCEVLLSREERFAKTAVGWVLRDISKHDRSFTERFVNDHLASFSAEALSNALKHFDKQTRADFRERRNQGPA